MLSLSEYLFCHCTILLGLPLFTAPPFIHILLREDNVLVRKGSLSFSLPSLVTSHDQIPFSLLTAPNEDSRSCIHLPLSPSSSSPASCIHIKRSEGRVYSSSGNLGLLLPVGEINGDKNYLPPTTTTNTLLSILFPNVFRKSEDCKTQLAHTFVSDF